MSNKFRSISLAGACFIVVATFVCEVTSEPPVRGGYANSLQNLEYGPPGGGKGGYGDANHEPANYDFQYEVFGGGNFFGHQESRRDQNTKGKYHVLLPDGRRQTVDYIADETGYHPTITYELIGNGDGGYGGGNNNKQQGGYSGGDENQGGYASPQAPTSGYGAPQTPSSGYGTPLDNSLGGGNRYSSRAKRQQVSDGQQFDLVRVYRPQSSPQQRFRNRRRRYSTPKKMYLIVYPDGVSTLKEALVQESIEKTEN